MRRFCRRGRGSGWRHYRARRGGWRCRRWRGCRRCSWDVVGGRGDDWEAVFVGLCEVGFGVVPAADGVVAEEGEYGVVDGDEQPGEPPFGVAAGVFVVEQQGGDEPAVRSP